MGNRRKMAINLLNDLKEDFGLTYLFISHDLSVVEFISDRVAVMYLGRLVEQADVRSIMKGPRHPYTMGLLASLPSLSVGKTLRSIRGSVPSLTDVPPGCPFHPRCTYSMSGRCDSGSAPPLEDVGGGRKVACVRSRDEELTGDSAAFAGMFEAAASAT